MCNLLGDSVVKPIGTNLWRHRNRCSVEWSEIVFFCKIVQAIQSCLWSLNTVTYLDLAPQRLYSNEPWRQRTKTLILKPGKEFTQTYWSTLQRRALVTHCIIFQTSWTVNGSKFWNLMGRRILLTAIYTFYPWSAAVSNCCHNFFNKLKLKWSSSFSTINTCIWVESLQ